MSVNQDSKLYSLAQKIIKDYENISEGEFSLFGIGNEIYVDMPIWQYGIEYINETSVQFSWLSEEQKKIERERGKLSESVIAYLLDWSRSKKRSCLALLAEFGMGKTTVLYRLEYLLAKEYIESSKARFPIRISLGHKRIGAELHVSLLNRIRDYLMDTHKLDFSVGELGQIIANDKVILLLDSFDEMPTRLTTGIQLFSLNQILNGVKAASALKLVIASRDNYFFSSGDIQEAFKNTDPFFSNEEFEVLYLRGFRHREIKRYLQLRLGQRADGFWDKLQYLHDLPDLARRPILLLMMTVLESQILSGEIRSRRQLYEQFIKTWIKREKLNQRLRLDSKEILHILKFLAEKASFNSEKSFSQMEIEDLIVREFDYTRTEARDYGADFKVCCFLGRDLTDNYRFLHKSFREYFWAHKILDDFQVQDFHILHHTFISLEVANFLLEMIDNHGEVVKQLQAIILSDKGEDYLLTNTMMLFELIVEDKVQVTDFYSELQTNQIENVNIEVADFDLPEGFVLVKGGAFLMGSWRGRPDETPVHEVIVDAFALHCYPVTNAEFLEFFEDTGYVTKVEKIGSSRIWTGGKWLVLENLDWKNPRNDNVKLSSRLNHPVVQITWEDAVAFCKWKSGKLGLVIELPTEAEWEYACRAGSLANWHFGNNEALLEGYAWYLDNLNRETYTQPVGKKKPNGWGFYDIIGNVREWCFDLYEKYPGNNLSWDLGNRYFSVSQKPYHVLRGGHFGSRARFLRSAIRVSGVEELATDYTGFRLKIRLD